MYKQHNTTSEQVVRGQETTCTYILRHQHDDTAIQCRPSSRACHSQTSATTVTQTHTNTKDKKRTVKGGIVRMPRHSQTLSRHHKDKTSINANMGKDFLGLFQNTRQQPNTSRHTMPSLRTQTNGLLMYKQHNITSEQVVRGQETTCTYQLRHQHDDTANQCKPSKQPCMP